MVLGDDNTLQGDFGEAWVEVVAAGIKVLHGRPSTLDLQKADVQLTWRGDHDGTFNPTVLVQVKTTTSIRELSDGSWGFDLDLPTYEVLRRDNNAIPRILVVIALSVTDERVRLHEDGTMLVGHARWVSIRGLDSVANTTTTVVHLPASQRLDEVGLGQMLKLHGSSTSTPVPDIDMWGTP